MIKLSSFKFSDILNKSVLDEFGETLGEIKDVYTTSENGGLRVIGYQIKKSGLVLDYEFRNISFYEKDNGRIKIVIKGSREILPRAYSYLLYRDLFYKKVVDLTTKTVVKVSELYMEEMAGEIRISKVECRDIPKYEKINLSNIMSRLLFHFGKNIKSRMLRCEDIEVIDLSRDKHNIAKRFDKLSEMHPADLADIIEDLDVTQRKEIFENLDEDLIADTLEEVNQDMKGEIIKELSDTKVVEVLESMPNDEIADMLDDLNEEEREKFLVNMQNEDAEEVKELLEYEDETVGAIMNTDYIAISLDITIKETLDLLKDMDPDEEVMNTIYITDDDNNIKGYVGYKNILLHSSDDDNNRKLSEFANTKFKTINYKEDIRAAVELLDKYDLLAVPVVDDDNKLVGSVLIHDIVDEILYPVWKKKNRIK